MDDGMMTADRDGMTGIGVQHGAFWIFVAARLRRGSLSPPRSTAPNQTPTSGLP